MNTSVHTEVIIALQGSGQFGVREAGSRGCALPSYTRKVWDFHPHRLMKDRSTSPTYGTRVDLHILHKVLRPPLLAVANYERLPQRIDYPISRYRSRCCVYFTPSRNVCVTFTQRPGRSALCHRAACAATWNEPITRAGYHHACEGLSTST